MHRDEILSDRYRLQTRLGQNPSRQTWLAIDLQTPTAEPVVLKLLALSPEMPWEECKLLEREATVLQRLQHPYIPAYRDYFLIEHHPGSRFPWFVLVQNYIPGLSLQQRLDQGQHFSESEIIQLAVEVLQNLSYLHHLTPPVLHRDLKPSNLIWGDDGHVYLVDFGAVQDQAVLEGATFTVVGTYGYVPVEQFGGQAVPASDLYALGATLIHLATGVPPADLPHPDGRILFGDRVSLDPGLVNWISALTDPCLTDRLQTADQALDALKHRHLLSAPLATPKPIGSQIAIRKSASQLEIRLPRRGTNMFQMNLLMTAIFSSSLGLAYFLPGALEALIRESIFRTWNLLLFFTVFVLPCLFILVWLLKAFSETHLRFDRDRFQVWRILFRTCYWRHTGKTASIKAIEAREQQFEAIGIVIKTCPSQAETQQLMTNPLSVAERVWLTQEINNWLQAGEER
jgi:serine/threonine protein kinase